MGAVITWILRQDRSRTGAFFFGMSEPNLLTILQQPWVMPGSDASLRAPWGPLGKDTPHPRAYGTHPKYFKTLTERLGIAPEEAIRRMTSLPAEAFEIPKRGVIREGYYADLVLLNPQLWKDTADYQCSHAFSLGVDTVMVNGSPVLRGGQLNPSMPRRGRFLTRA
jgi:N-acyl-D-amino-acid deacylase